MKTLNRATLTFSFLICFTFFLMVSAKGQTLNEIMSNQVSLPNGWKLSPVVKCAGLSQEKFKEHAEAAKVKCPISRLYAGGTASIELDAQLV